MSKAPENGVITYKGQKVRLNHRLIVQKELTDTEVEAILALHKRRIDIEDLMMASHDVGELGILNDQWLEVQYQLQEAWKFEFNPDFVRWFDVPRCSCAKLDNAEALGTPYHIYNQECPIHGW